jgi:hypothetical protein
MTTEDTPRDYMDRRVEDIGELLARLVAERAPATTPSVSNCQPGDHLPLGRPISQCRAYHGDAMWRCDLERTHGGPRHVAIVQGVVVAVWPTTQDGAR